MLRTKRATPSSPTADESPATLEEALTWLASLSADRVNLQPLTEGLLRERFALHAALGAVRTQQDKLREKIEALTAPEHYPAVITAVHANGQAVVEVQGAGTRLQVTVDPDIPPESLRVGARGLLSRSRSCLLRLDPSPHEWAEVATFEGYLDGRKRLLLRYQEQLLAATAADGLAGVELRKGDLVGFDRDGSRLAFTRVEPPGREDLFFEETPADRFEELGGLDREIALLERLVRFRLLHPEVATRYRLPSKHGILLEGPPGNGKTKLARCLARFIAELVPAGECRFMAVSGSSDYSMWLGQSEQRIIARFEAARKLAAGAVPVVLFFDEVDAIGRRRGSDVGGTAPDRILSTLLAQLDGIRQVSNLIVIGATNRADVLDGGLLRPGRLGDVKIRIPGPNRQAARAILRRYLGAVPVAGEPPLLVEALLSRLYSPQGEYSELARVTFRDGRKLAVGGRDLVSGAMLENVVRVAAEEAADREVRTGKVGVQEADLVTALERELGGAVGVLSPHNIRTYVLRLPQEVEPVAVEPIRRGPELARYVRMA